MLIKNMPVYWRIKALDASRPQSIPERRDFRFAQSGRGNTLVQQRSNELEKILSEIYAAPYNIGYHQEASTFGGGYREDFLEYMRRYLIMYPEIRTILEIGCGGCLILDELRKLGYSVAGIDPSPVAAAAAEKLGIALYRGLFPSEQIENKFDLIFHVDVLEHITDAESFLKAQRDKLKIHGVVIVNVPDASESIQSGDVSLAMHQHINYFTKQSLTTLLEQSGFVVENVSKAKYGGSLYAVATRREGTISPSVDNVSRDESRQFLEMAPITAARVCARIMELHRELSGNLGFYVPLRAAPYLALCDYPENIRVFDDTVHWQGGFIDGLPYKIEGAEALRGKPPAMVCVMSWTFEEIIRRRIEELRIPGMFVTSLRELCHA